MYCSFSLLHIPSKPAPKPTYELMIGNIYLISNNKKKSDENMSYLKPIFSK